MPNTLYYGDNLDVLRHKIRAESIDLCYIDPPFNSKRNYFQIYNNVGKDDTAQAQAFVDTWTWNEQAAQGYQDIIANVHGYTAQTVELIKGLRMVLGTGALLAYIVSMTQRIDAIWRVLKPTGSFYLHCDPTCSHYLKLVLDSVFCGRGGDYVNEISWKRTSAHSDAKQGNVLHMGRIHDVILFYVKSHLSTRNEVYAEYNQSYVDKFYRHTDEDGRKYCLGDLTGPGGAAKGNPQYEFLGVTRYWRYSRENMQKLYDNGRIIQKKAGRVPMYKRYLDEMRGIPLQDVWDNINPISAQAKERLGYPTQKPEALLERIIQASSNEGDVILDAYCGCGTTIAVAQRLRRNWIGIDITYQSIAVMLKRLEDSFGTAVTDSIILDGIPRDMASAQALAHKKDDRLRKEFEKWAVLTYSRNRAIIHEKKGADKGIDGIAYFMTGSDTSARVVFQMKSGKVQRNDIATLDHDRVREKAELAVLITLEEPTTAMQEEALSVGMYYQPLLHRDFPRIQIVTIHEMIMESRRIELPLGAAVLRSALETTRATQGDWLHGSPP